LKKMLATAATWPLGYTCIDAVNTQDTEYAVPIRVGNPPYEMKVAPDTGSFQLVLASKACKDCEAHCMGCPEHRLFDGYKSSSFKLFSQYAPFQSSYGQGTVSCYVGGDQVSLGAATTDGIQMMDLIYDNNGLQGFSTDNSYDGIMGLGVTAGVPVGNTTDLAPSTLSALGVKTFGICFGQRSGQGGRLDLGSGVPGLTYTDVPGVGVGYWTIQLNGFRAGERELGGCDVAPHCLAIIDSGTTLMGLPSSMYDEVLKAIGEIAQDCSNVDSLPTLTIPVQNYTLTLPPSVYVSYQTDLEFTQPVQIGPFKADVPAGTGSACTHLFFKSELIDATTNAPVLLIGMPIFRRYAIRFDRGAVASNVSITGQGHKLAFAPVEYGDDICASCTATATSNGTSPSRETAAAALEGTYATALLPSAEVAPTGWHGGHLLSMSARRRRLPAWGHRVERGADGAYRMAV